VNTAAKISIIIPNYNHSGFLKQRIDSVLNQTYQDFEVIILDDCSTDNSVQVIEAYRGHPKISHIVINGQNSGSPFLQWKKGIQLAKGEWIWMAESDDWCEPNFLEELTSKIKDETSILFCQSIFIDENGKRIFQSKWPSDHEEIYGSDFISGYLTKGCYIVNASMCIFRKKYFDEVSSDFTKYKFIGDWVLWHKMASKGNVIVSGKQLNYFRKHDADVSGKAFKQGLSYTEYFTFLDSLHNDKILSLEDRREVVALRFYEFLNDTRMEPPYRAKIKSLFHSKLGYKFYLHQTKHWLVKNIKTPLFTRIGIKRTQFQNFSRY